MKKLLNPIAHYNEYVLLGIGLISVVLNVVGGHFFQYKMISLLKYERAQAGWNELSASALVSYGSGILALFLYGLWINRKTRLLDIVNTVMLASIPPFLMLWMFRYPFMAQFLDKLDPQHASLSETAFLMLVALVALSILSYFCVLLYRGFKTATNLKTTLQIVLFVLVVFVVSTFSPYLLKL